MKKMITTSICMALIWCCSCHKELLEYEQGDICVHIEQGSAWLHDFPLFMGIKRKNPPQIAVWIEDTDGKYISTVFATHRIATQSWISAGGNRRKEALPHWCHARNVRYADGLYLPTKEEPLTDGISGATPRTGFALKMAKGIDLRQFVVKAEFNHSTDFNDHYPKSATEGEATYSGGKMGSGQPAVVYAAQVDLDSGQRSFEAHLIGHSSPDGSDGELRTDLTQLTSALQIVERITITIR